METREVKVACPPIAVIDNGSYAIRTGRAGESTPRDVLHSVIGETKQADESGVKTTFIGNDAQSKRDILNLRYSIQHGFVTNWDDMEKIWSHVLDDLRAESQEPIPVVLTEMYGNPKPNKERTSQIMFEKFNVPSMGMCIQSVLSLYASGRTTGIVLDSGYGVTHAVPVNNGFAVKDAVQKIEFGGCDVTKYLSTMLKERHGDCFASTDEDTLLETANNMKETIGFVAPRDTVEMSPKSYTLPDGKVMEVGEERYKCTEAIFNPYLSGLKSTGLQEALYGSICKCNVDLRRDLFANIVISGGNMAFSGTGDRMEKEVTLLAEPAMKVKVSGGPECKYSAWIGGSILGSMGFKEISVTKMEYEEHGASIIHTKP